MTKLDYVVRKASKKLTTKVQQYETLAGITA